MAVILHISGNLRAIRSDLPEVMELAPDGPVSLRDLLIRAGINPLIVVRAVADGRSLEFDEPVEDGAEIGLIGPVAGG